MNNQEILDDAPEGATHYSQGMHYLSLNSSNNWMRYDPNGFKNAKWFKADDYLLAYCNKSFRSLADIKRIAELEEENKVVSDLLRSESKRSEIRDLEQQAKGIEEYVSAAMDNNHILHLNKEDIYELFLINTNKAALRLRKRAKQLKEQHG